MCVCVCPIWCGIFVNRCDPLFALADPPVYPNVTTPSRRVFSYEGSNVTLICEEWRLSDDSRRPDSITWYHDENVTKIEDVSEVLKQRWPRGRDIVRLRRTNVSAKDEGKYRCEFQGEHGKHSAEIELVVFRRGEERKKTVKLRAIRNRRKKRLRGLLAMRLPDIQLWGCAI